MNRLTARERRLLAIGILVLALAALWLGVVSPVLQGFAARRELRAQAEQDYARNARLIAAFPLGRVRAEAQRLDREGADYAFPTAAAPQAAEAARGRVAAAVAAEGGVLQALRLQSAPPRRVRLQADLRIGAQGLTRLLRRLQTDRPFATVDTLSIASADAAAGPSAGPLQEIRLELTYAYR